MGPTVIAAQAAIQWHDSAFRVGTSITGALIPLKNEDISLGIKRTDMKGAYAPLGCRLRGNDELSGRGKQRSARDGDVATLSAWYFLNYLTCTCSLV
ncbi:MULTISPECIES: hypothetical protein [unclassified Undibacterium]|uniref:hypothetical protein n=1 Tax=unclassified Undibacterium TaxID=2630295 RepID=UPI002AC8EF71|nr:MULTISPECIES: hypothetical protein [unclassified Undibacterium]MEB0141188.1 hypothetical protein [Undibacterium sp. CCC2.1]MEB0174248.1 hypothetical protein [Undibacterium sp. CCC1.1]MEB0178195.1 hypothetical protein [Undibacterium sp. CCC3.4]MEB0217401.1 hypothetical protein [Undibacterium sp. 5I2]WPX42137.1 hypothetical protein RHM61_12060 [Undibacterium sp. CCC3.4]